MTFLKDMWWWLLLCYICYIAKLEFVFTFSWFWCFPSFIGSRLPCLTKLIDTEAKPTVEIAEQECNLENSHAQWALLRHWPHHVPIPLRPLGHRAKTRPANVFPGHGSLWREIQCPPPPFFLSKKLLACVPLMLSSAAYWCWHWLLRAADL